MRPASVHARRGLLVGGLVAAGLLVAQAAGLRAPIQPGPLLAVHSTATTGRCQECHASDPRSGAAASRCERCHDAGGGSQHAHAGHVARIAAVGRGSGKPGPDALACAQCHVEHRGEQGLAQVDERWCLRCHDRAPGESGQSFRVPDFATHPEFHAVRALAGAGGQASVESTGLVFSHETHATYVTRDLRRAGEASLQQVCERCHQVAASASAGRRRPDFVPVSYAIHCSACHTKQLPMTEGVPAAAAWVPGRGRVPCAEAGDAFGCGDEGSLRKASVEHADAWVLHGLAVVARELDPAAFDRERAGLLARAGQLRRQVYLATPLASLSRVELAARRKAFQDELAAIDGRLAALGGNALPAARVAEVVRAAETAGRGADAAPLKQDAPALTAPAAGADERREEVLALLAEVEAAADRVLRAPNLPEEQARAARARKGRAAEMRRRLLALVPGTDAAAALKAVRGQRAAEIARIDDELQLRDGGVPAAPLADRGRAAKEAELRRIQRRLAVLADTPAPAGPADGPRRAVLEQAVRALVGGENERCRTCHVVRGATIVDVHAAERVLPLSPFSHAPHLGARPAGGWPARPAAPAALPEGDLRGQETSCGHCHRRTGGGPEIQFSKDARDLHVMPVEGCRSCHRAGAIREDCQLCHSYHPPAS